MASGATISGSFARIIVRAILFDGLFLALKYSPLLNFSVEYSFINVLKPSSIHIYLRSFEPTIIGNQLCPNSWLVTSHSSPVCDFQPQNTIPGYSIPPTVPATFVATG